MVFVDSGYWLALESADDQNHAVAVAQGQKLLADMPRLVTTSYVFDEVVTFFNRRNRHAKAVELGSVLFESSFVELVHVDAVLLDSAWKYFVHHPDKRYSLRAALALAAGAQAFLGQKGCALRRKPRRSWRRDGVPYAPAPS